MGTRKMAQAERVAREHTRNATALIGFVLGVGLSNGARAIGMSQIFLVSVLAAGTLYHVYRAVREEEAQP
jgi:hypothetical protein